MLAASYGLTVWHHHPNRESGLSTATLSMTPASRNAITVALARKSLTDLASIEGMQKASQMAATSVATQQKTDLLDGWQRLLHAHALQPGPCRDVRLEHLPQRQLGHLASGILNSKAGKAMHFHVPTLGLEPLC